MLGQKLAQLRKPLLGRVHTGDRRLNLRRLHEPSPKGFDLIRRPRFATVLEPSQRVGDRPDADRPAGVGIVSDMGEERVEAQRGTGEAVGGSEQMGAKGVGPQLQQPGLRLLVLAAQPVCEFREATDYIIAPGRPCRRP